MKQTLITIGILVVLGALVLLFANVARPRVVEENPISNVPAAKLPPGSMPPGSQDFMVGNTFGWREGMMADRTPVELIKAEAFTVTFGADGKISGTTDCNGFGGDYQIGSDGIITFGPFMSTKMYCEGSQETVFLDLLSKVNHYQVVNELNVLILESDDGMMVLGKQQ